MKKRILGAEGASRDEKGTGGGEGGGEVRQVDRKMPRGNSLLHMLIKNSEPVCQKEKEETRKERKMDGWRMG